MRWLCQDVVWVSKALTIVIIYSVRQENSWTLRVSSNDEESDNQLHAKVTIIGSKSELVLQYLQDVNWD